jgi:hypothetical protein
MLEIDIDDFVIPHKLDCIATNPLRAEQNACFTMLPRLLNSIDQETTGAIQFANSYFYLLDHKRFQEQEHVFYNHSQQEQEQQVEEEWLIFASQYALLNFKMQKLFKKVI